MDRPRTGRDCYEEAWKTFVQKWTMVEDSAEMTEAEKRCQLYQCCEEDLAEAILKRHADVVNYSQRELLRMLKQLAVIPVSVLYDDQTFLEKVRFD